MQFHYAAPPDFAYYAQPDPYGYYAEPPEMAGWGMAPYGVAGYGVPGYGAYEPMGGYGAYEPMGGYAEPPELAYYGETDPFGYYAEPEYGEWGEVDPFGAPVYRDAMDGYAESPEFSEMEPVGYYADENPMAGYAESPELVGWGETPSAYEGYVREARRPAFNPGCPLPTNVAGLGAVELEGYMRPVDVNPTCDTFTPQPGVTAQVPDTFRPLW